MSAVNNVPIQSNSSPLDHAENVANGHSEKNATRLEQPPEHTVAQTRSGDEEVPEGGYGWVCVLCCALINAHTWGVNSSYAVFLAYYLSNNVFPDATYLDFAFVGGLSVSLAMGVSPLATTLIGKCGTRITLLVGIFFETLSFIGASFAIKTWQLFLSQGVCFGVGMGFLFVASVAVPPQWFKRRRSLANACASGGSGLGALVYSLAADAIIENPNLGLGWAFRIIGILAFVVNTTCAILIRDRNKTVGSKHAAFDIALFTRPQFCLLQGWSVFSMLGYIVLLFSLPNYGKQVVGLTSYQGSILSALLNLGQGLGRPPVGYFSDRIGRINMSMGCTFACGLFVLVIWVFANSYGVLIFFAVITGTVAGTFWATVAPLTAECLPLWELPSALNITWLTIVLPTTFSEPIALEIASRSKAGYLGAQLFAGFMYMAAAGCLWGLKTWMIGQNDRKIGIERGWIRRAVTWKKV